MSRIVHRQPIWTWSLVLLSTLLLSPSTAAVVLAALRQANVATVPVEATLSPYRATTEEEAREAAAQSGRLKRVPLAPTRALVIVPELNVVRSDSPVPSAPRSRYEQTPHGSRAPPRG